MASLTASRFATMALALAGLGLAAVAVGATQPEFPVTGKGDQAAVTGDCSTAVVDDIRVCRSEMHVGAGASVVTVAPGLSIVQ